MKQQITIMLTALLVATTMQAQTPLTAARNSFRDGDRIEGLWVGSGDHFVSLAFR